MGRYRRVDVRMYTDEKFRRLSAPKPNGQSLWQWMITSRVTYPFGLVQVGFAGMAEEIGWPPGAFRRCFNELCQEGLLSYDYEHRVLWVPNILKYNPPRNPNVFKSWLRLLDEIPTCGLKSQAFQALKSLAERLGDTYGNAFLNTFANAVPSESETETETEVPEQYISDAEKTELSPNQLAELYNATCPPAGLPRITVPLSTSRKKKAATRLREHPEREWWESVFAQVISVPFLRGEGGRDGWTGATFLWLTEKSDNALKVYEKVYRKPNQKLREAHDPLPAL